MHHIDGVALHHVNHNSSLNPLCKKKAGKSEGRLRKGPGKSGADAPEELVKPGIAYKHHPIDLVRKQFSQFRLRTGMSDQPRLNPPRTKETEIVKREKCLTAKTGRSIFGSYQDSHSFAIGAIPQKP